MISGNITDEATTADDAGMLTIGLVADNEGGVPYSGGNITGDLDLSNSTLALATAVDLSGGPAILVSTLNTNGNTFFLDGPTALESRTTCRARVRSGRHRTQSRSMASTTAPS